MNRVIKPYHAPDHTADEHKHNIKNTILSAMNHEVPTGVDEFVYIYDGEGLYGVQAAVTYENYGGGLDHEFIKKALHSMTLIPASMVVHGAYKTFTCASGVSDMKDVTATTAVSPLGVRIVGAFGDYAPEVQVNAYVQFKCVPCRVTFKLGKGSHLYDNALFMYDYIRSSTGRKTLRRAHTKQVEGLTASNYIRMADGGVDSTGDLIFQLDAVDSGNDANADIDLFINTLMGVK